MEKVDWKQMLFHQNKYSKTKMKTKRHYNDHFLIPLSSDNDFNCGSKNYDGI